MEAEMKAELDAWLSEFDAIKSIREAVDQKRTESTKLILDDMEWTWVENFKEPCPENVKKIFKYLIDASYDEGASDTVISIFEKLNAVMAALKLIEEAYSDDKK